MNIKLTSITPAPWNTRGEITDESVKELAESIKEQGLINPLTIWKDAEGEWLCIAGNRRLAALKLIGATLDEGDTVVFDGDEAGARTITITENLQREDVGIVEEANAVTTLLDAGKSMDWIQARLGKSRHWVERRRRLAALTDEWRKIADRIDADALERVAAYPADVQTKLAKYADDWRSWKQMRYYFESEMQHLDKALFDTSACKKCESRTGALGDLFGKIDDGSLGQCMNCKCYERMRDEWAEEEIAKIVGDAEVVRVNREWNLPSGDDASPERTKKHPCAYVYVYCTGEPHVVWSFSAKAKKEEEERKEEEKRQEYAIESAKRERIRSITTKLEEFMDGEEANEIIRKEVTDLLPFDCAETLRDYIASTVAESACSWHSNQEWTRLILAFPTLIDKAGLTNDEAQTLIDEYRIDVDDNGDNEGDND